MMQVKVNRFKSLFEVRMIPRSRQPFPSKLWVGTAALCAEIDGLECTMFGHDSCGCMQHPREKRRERVEQDWHEHHGQRHDIQK